VADEWDKQALLAVDSQKFFTTAHYNSYPAVLVRLPMLDVDELELIEFVVGLNKVHRHMTKSQWAMTYADKVLPAIEDATKKRRNANLMQGTSVGPGVPLPDKSGNGLGEAVDVAGAMAGVSGDYIGLAKKVTKEAPVHRQRYTSSEE
jgi:hypothetical protein